MNDNFCMSKDIFKAEIDEFLEKPFFVGMDGSDLEDIFWLVERLLAAERDAVKDKEPYAHNTIDRLEAARREVFMMSLGIEEAFEEVYGE